MALFAMNIWCPVGSVFMTQAVTVDRPGSAEVTSRPEEASLAHNYWLCSEGLGQMLCMLKLNVDLF